MMMWCIHHQFRSSPTHWMQRNHAMGGGNRWLLLDKLTLPKKSDSDAVQSFICPLTRPGSTTGELAAHLFYSSLIGAWRQDLPLLPRQRDAVRQHCHPTTGNHRPIRFIYIYICIYICIQKFKGYTCPLNSEARIGCLPYKQANWMGRKIVVGE